MNMFDGLSTMFSKPPKPFRWVSCMPCVDKHANENCDIHTYPNNGKHWHEMRRRYMIAHGLEHAPTPPYQPIVSNAESRFVDALTTIRRRDDRRV